MFTNAANVRSFVLAGRGYLTVLSTKTGARFTYGLSAAKDDPTKIFVRLLTGQDNESSYRYLGLLTPITRGMAGHFKLWLTAKSCASDEAPSVVAFRYLVSRVINQPTAPIPEGLEIRHDGRCGKCHRLLTTPESIDRGIGPECWKKVGLVAY